MKKKKTKFMTDKEKARLVSNAFKQLEKGQITVEQYDDIRKQVKEL